MADKPHRLPPGVADAIINANKALTLFSERRVKMAQEAIRKIEDYRVDWIQDLVKAVEQARKAVDIAWPANWRGLDNERIGKALDLAEEATIPIIWLPPRPVLEPLLDASTFEAREAVLANHRGEIIDAAKEALTDSRIQAIPAQAELAGMAEETISAAEAGLDRAAQTFAASGIGLLIHDVLGYALLGDAFKKLSDRAASDATVLELRLVCLQLATSNTLIDTDRGPDGFNRHGTQHGDQAHFSGPAMLGGLMLLVGWIRELSYLAEHHPEVFVESPASV